jgi:rubrerythrin
MSPERKSDVPTPAPPSLSEILDTQARLESQVGEIYVIFAVTFSHNLELRALWSAMALEEGGHAALLRAVNKGLLSGVLHAQSFLLPVEFIDSLAAQVAEYHRQAQTGASLDQALRITWELECSELNFLRELLVSSSTLAQVGFPTSPDGDEEHIARLREMIQKYTADEGLRREVRFLAAERSVR